ncbi:MAG TPA: OmpA family protein [Fibrobacteraceae bacterium]|nr:OmpA family protein [Fibrobacteraceae bacterium]
MIPTKCLSFVFLLVFGISLVWANNMNTGGQKGVSRTVSTWQLGQGTFNGGVSVLGNYAYHGIEYTDANGVFHKESPWLLSQDAFLGLGLTNWADFSVDMPFYQDFWDGRKTYGVGDVGAALKLEHVGLDKNAPLRVAYLGRFSFPTASKGEGYFLRHSYYSYQELASQYGKYSYGAGGVRFQPQIIWTIDFEKFPGRTPFSINGNIGPNVYLTTKERANQGSSAAVVWALSFDYEPIRYALYTEFSGEILFQNIEEGTNPLKDANKNVFLFTVGAAKKFQSGLRTDLAFDFSLCDRDNRTILYTSDDVDGLVDAGDSLKYTIPGTPRFGARLTLSYQKRGERAKYALGRFFGSPEDTVRVTVVKYDTVKVIKNDTVVVTKTDTLRVRDTQEPQSIIQYGVVIFRNLNFRVNSANLLPSAYSVLDNIAASMTRFPEVKIEVRGYTDISGDPHKNLALSSDRAKGVMNYLISKGISADRLRSYGLGDADPIADNSTSEGRVLNRRVEIKRVDSFKD